MFLKEIARRRVDPRRLLHVEYVENYENGSNKKFSILPLTLYLFLTNIEITYIRFQKK